jgi:hypothetical protein
MFWRCNLLLLVLVVSGCGLSPEYRARMQAQAAADQLAQEQADDAHCRSLGAEPGSTAYVYCREATSQNRQAREDANRAASLQMMQNGLEMLSQSPPPPQPAAPADHVCIAANNTLYRC